MSADVLIPIILGAAAVIVGVSAVAYPQAFPSAPTTTHRLVFFGGLFAALVLFVAAVVIGLSAKPESRRASSPTTTTAETNVPPMPQPSANAGQPRSPPPSRRTESNAAGSRSISTSGHRVPSAPETNADARLVSNTTAQADQTIEQNQTAVWRARIAVARKQSFIGEEIFDLLISADTDEKFVSARQQVDAWDLQSANMVGKYWGVEGRKYYLSKDSTGETYSPRNFGKYNDPGVYWDRQRYLSLVRARQAALGSLADRAQESAGN